MLDDNIKSVQVEVLDELGKGERVFSPGGVLNSCEGINFVVDLVSEKEVGFLEDFAGDTVGDHVAEGEFVVANVSSVVEGQVSIVLVEVDSESVVGMAVLAFVGGSQSQTGGVEALVYVEGGVKIPFFIPSFNNTIVEVQLEVVGGLDFGVEGAALG